MTRKDDRGFTLIELLVVIVIIGILAAMALPNFVKAREKAKEAEVKSNIHAIQVALERYAVESGGVYPLMLYGGDNTDSFTTRKTANYFDSTDTEQIGYSEFDGDVDTLIEFGYLAQYPRNPFQRKRDIEKYGRLLTQPSQYNLPQLLYRVNIWSQHPAPTHGNADRSQQLCERQVGGEKGNLMWDISEGQRHSPFPIVVVPDPDPDSPTNYYHYVNPTTANNFANVANYRDDYLFFLMPGNFYYYATFAAVGGYNSFVNGQLEWPVISEVTGFNLAGYGSMTNPAKDVYNIVGDYPDRSLFTLNKPQDTTDFTLDDLDKLYVGPDGRNDGVILVVQSGSDRKTPENLEVDDQQN
jgi:prepilin-type N-terminal cleavage/methylation domain-containing protein